MDLILTGSEMIDKNEEIIIRNTAFNDSVNLVNFMNNYVNNMNDEDRRILDLGAKFSRNLLLPSGRFGNAIALALEINNYVAAEYLIESADRLELDTNIVASEPEGKNNWSLKDEYLYSKHSYYAKPRPKYEFERHKEYNKYINIFVRNYQAKERLEEKITIISENKNKLNKKK